MNRYLRFEMVEKKPTTEVYVVSSLKKFDTEVLAKISWYGKWRRYVFYPSEGTLFDAACLGEVKEFIDNLMKERKQANMVRGQRVGKTAPSPQRMENNQDTGAARGHMEGYVGGKRKGGRECPRVNSDIQSMSRSRGRGYGNSSWVNE
jgi:hypothetical protein